jgi:hypothetical protein
MPFDSDRTHPRRIRAFGLAAVVVVVVGVTVTAACDSGTPTIAVGRSYVDLGEIEPRPVEADVGVANLGRGTLRILGVATSCGCTRAWMSDSVLTAGGAATLTVRYDPTAMTPADSGVIHRAIYLQSNDPRRPEVQVDFYAVVRAPGSP